MEDVQRGTGDYSALLQKRLAQYTASSTRTQWLVLAQLFLVRPHRVLEESIVYEGYYTITNARDRGTIMFSNTEIGVAPALFREFNISQPENAFANPLLLKHISNEEEGTWEDFENAHALYLCAVISALIQQQARFSTMALGTLLRHAKPEDSAHLAHGLALPAAFNKINLIHANKQSIPKVSKSKHRKLKHKVDLITAQQVVLACNHGTPIIDAHLNLKLGRDQSIVNLGDVALFIQ